MVVFLCRVYFSSRKYSHEPLQGLLILMLQSESENKLNMPKIPHFSNFS